MYSIVPWRSFPSTVSRLTTQSVCEREAGSSSIGSDSEAAAVSLNEASSIFRGVGDKSAEAGCLRELGMASVHRGDLDAAAALTQEALPI